MTGNFLKFKRKLQAIRILKALLAGVALGGLAGGIVLILSKLALLNLAPILSLPVALGVFFASGVTVYFALKTSDKKLAEELDETFALQEKVQTMVAYREEEESGMLSLQREDAEQALASIPVNKFKPKRLWIYLVAFCVGVSSLLSGFIVKDKRNVEEPAIPFKISAMQIAGIEELIRYVDSSEMELVFRQAVSAHLTMLLTDLKAATTQPEMETALASAMAYIQATTYDSSSSTEILNELWNTEEPFTQTLAKTLDTSEWTNPEWGDYAEKMTAFRQAFRYEPPEGEEPLTDEEIFKKLQWNLENTALKINLALQKSGIPQDDALYASLYNLANEKQGEPDSEHLFGFVTIAKAPSVTTLQQAETELDNTFKGMNEELYAVISQMKKNTNVGEYTMKKLATLFPVPLPAFERPDFSKTGGNNQNGDSEDKENNGTPDGGIGEGAIYGSDDLVLDPMTGEYVKYGTLLDRYYAVMYEKLENGTYTEEQKEIIKNYFALLYSGIKKEEGN